MEETSAQQVLPLGYWSHYRLLRHPLFVVNLVSIVILYIISSFDDPTIEPYLKQFNLTNAEIGTFYAVNDVADCLGSIVVGILSAYELDKLCIFIGVFLSAVSYAIIGPAPFLPLEPSLTLIYTAQILRGIGTSAMEVCPWVDSLRYIVNTAGYPDTVQTNGFVVSVSNQFNAVTSIAVPPLAGYLAANYGYRDSTMFMFVLLSLWTMVTGYVWLKFECSACRRDCAPYIPLPRDIVADTVP